MKLLVVRHGETEWNRSGLLQGVHDTLLTEKGIEQARETAKKLRGIPIDAAFVSPLRRTRQTAEILLDGRRIPVFYDERFREHKFGEAEGMKVSEVDLSDSWTFGAAPKYRGMESADEFCGRVFAGLDEIYAAYPDSTVLLVTHGGVSVAVGYYFLGPPAGGSLGEYYLANCAVREYVKNP